MVANQHEGDFRVYEIALIAPSGAEVGFVRDLQRLALGVRVLSCRGRRKRDGSMTSEIVIGGDREVVESLVSTLSDLHPVRSTRISGSSEESMGVRSACHTYSKSKETIS